MCARSQSEGNFGHSLTERSAYIATFNKQSLLREMLTEN